jgi:hypothetical protein
MFFDNAIYEAGVIENVDEAMIAIQNLISEAVEKGIQNHDVTITDGEVTSLPTLDYFLKLDLYYRIGARRANEIRREELFDQGAFQNFIKINYPDFHKAIKWMFVLPEEVKPSTFPPVESGKYYFEEDLPTCLPTEDIENAG